MSRSPERTPDAMPPALCLSLDHPPTFAVTSPPRNQQNVSIIAQRRLPPPICSDRISSYKWFCGPVKAPQPPLTPPIGPPMKAIATSGQSHGTMLRTHPSAISIRSPAKPQALPKATELPNARRTAAATDNDRHPPPEPTQTPTHRASNNNKTTAQPQTPPSPTTATATATAPQDPNPSPTPAAQPNHNHKLIKQVLHKVIERERRRKCSEIIQATATAFLPDLQPDVSSNSHKSLVPRNILLEYSYAHIVCLAQKCDLLDRECDALRRRERKDHARSRSSRRCEVGKAQARLHSSRERTPGLEARDTPPASSPSSPAVRQRADCESEDPPPRKYRRLSPDLLRPPGGNGGRSSWRAEVAGEIRAFVERRRRACCETEGTSAGGRKRKRSVS